MSYYCSISSLYEIWILNLTCRQANITANFHTNRIKRCTGLSFIVTLNRNKWRAAIEIHGGAHIKARTKCSEKTQKGYIIMCTLLCIWIHLCGEWERVSLCWHTRQMKDMQIAIALTRPNSPTAFIITLSICQNIIHTCCQALRNHRLTWP